MFIVFFQEVDLPDERMPLPIEIQINNIDQSRTNAYIKRERNRKSKAKERRAKKGESHVRRLVPVVCRLG